MKNIVMEKIDALRRENAVSEAEIRRESKTAFENATRTGKIGENYIAVVPLYLLNVPDYQRPIVTENASQIVNHYDPKKVGIVKVSYLGGKLNLIDGQHRVYAMLMRKETHVTVEIITVQNRKEEIQTYIELNTQSKKLSAYAIHRAGLAAENPIDIALKKVCTEIGLNIPHSDMRLGKGKLTCVEVCRQIIKQNGADRFYDICKLIVDLGWYAEPRAFGSETIRAVNFALSNGSSIAKMLKRFKDRPLAKVKAEAQLRNPTLGGTACLKKYFVDATISY